MPAMCPSALAIAADGASAAPPAPIRLGDPVPWFSVRTIAGATIDLHVDAGRWVVLAFVGSLDDPRARHELAPLLAAVQASTDEHLVAYVVLADLPSPAALDALRALSGPGLAFIADHDGAVGRNHGALDAPRTIVLDPMLRAVANIGWDHPAGHAATVQSVLRGLPAVDQSCGVPMTAPALIVPRVLDFPLCDLLVRLYDQWAARIRASCSTRTARRRPSSIIA